MNHEDGAFAEHVAAKASVTAKIPDSMSFEEAATFGVGVTTVGQALYQSLGLPYPTEPTNDKIHLLIYGGSTATGTLAIQYAKLYVAPSFIKHLSSISVHPAGIWVLY